MDVFLLGGQQLAALDSTSPSAGGEDSTFEFLSRRIVPAGGGGDAEYRRLYVTVAHWGSFQIKITPVVDGQEVVSSTATLTGVGGTVNNPKRQTFLVPLGRPVAGFLGRWGLRGHSFRVKIEAPFAAQAGSWHIEAIEVTIKVAHRAKKST